MSHSITRRRRWRTCATTLALTLGSLAVPAAALADGQLDPAFNGTGYHLGTAGEGTVFTNSDNRIPMIAQADGRIVVGGSRGGLMTLVRYNANGTLDGDVRHRRLRHRVSSAARRRRPRATAARRP